MLQQAEILLKKTTLMKEEFHEDANNNLNKEGKTKLFFLLCPP